MNESPKLSSSPASSWVELLQARAQRLGARTAYTFLEDGEDDASSLTYAELDVRARQIAARLQRVASPGDRALLLYPPGLEYIAAFFGCLYAGVVAVPVYPPDPSRLERTLPRVQAISVDAGAKLVLSNSFILGLANDLFELVPDLKALTWISTDSLTDPPEGWRPLALGPDSLAFLQYTSGSTGAPKGVMLTHGNLLRNQEMIEQGFSHGKNPCVVGWLPMYHDMGLIGTVLHPLYLGAPCFLMSPWSFLSSPLRWLKAISKYRGTGSGGPNFAYELCVRKSTEAERRALDLSCWEIAFTGAEPIRPDTMRRFSEAFAISGFRADALYPCYGLAEATLIVSGRNRKKELALLTLETAPLEQNQIAFSTAAPPTPGVRDFVGCGEPLGDERVLIVDPVTRTLSPFGSVGEVWVSGGNVAKGYWNKPEATSETFGGRVEPSKEGPFLRTGDLGFFKGAELYVTGRLKDLIIIRGRNLYPQDIERTAEQTHPAIRPGCSAAFPVETPAGEGLVLVCEVTVAKVGDPAQLVNLLREAVAQAHEVQPHRVVLMKSGGVPKTSSGKIQRSEARLQLGRHTLELFHDWSARSRSL